jgi:hypothetical protein
MKGFLLIVVSALAVNLCSSSWADDATKFPSPDGTFAMLLTENQKEAGRVKIELIDVDSRKVVLVRWKWSWLRTTTKAKPSLFIAASQRKRLKLYFLFPAERETEAATTNNQRSPVAQ